MSVPTSRLVLAAAYVAVVALPLVGVMIPATVDREGTWRAQQAQLDADSFGRGFLVWESSRSGAWRIWRRGLDGGSPAQVSIDEPGRDHFCPHLSPDGQRIVYLSMPTGVHCYMDRVPDGAATELRLAHLDGSSDRVIAAEARGYFEDRAALWVDDDTLVYIHGNGSTRRRKLSTGSEEVLVRWDQPGHGWLVNATETHATAGWPSFSLFEPERKRVLFRHGLPGCQPYFTRDGRWGFWTAGPGGPIQRYDLATREASAIVEQHDARLPATRRYVYFPMVSACQNLIAFAGSAYAHDHFSSDYDVFVARLDPWDLEILADPVRYTFDAACDRFPDVHFAPMRLGKERGTVPFAVDFGARVEGSGWTWDFGDGAGEQDSPRHRYDRPGRYWVTARGTDETGRERVWRGQVRALAPRGPELVTARLVEPEHIVVEFDIPVAAADGGVEVVLRGDRVPKVVGAQIDRSDPRRVSVRLARALRQKARLEILGGLVGAEAERGGLPVREGASITVLFEAWPVDPAGLAFAFEEFRAENLALEAGTDAAIAFDLQPAGIAWYDDRRALWVDSGSFASPRAAANIGARVRDADAFSFSCVVEPESGAGDGVIVELVEADGRRDFWIERRGAEYVLGLRHAPDAAPLELTVPAAGDSMAHVAISARGGSNPVAGVTLNGQSRASLDGRPISLAHWQPTELRIGPASKTSSVPKWRGALHHIAAYSTTRTAEELARDHALVEAWTSRLPDVAVRRAPRATLVAKASIPSLQDIAPYREAMAVFEFRTAAGETVRAATWALLDGQRTPMAEAPLGSTHDLELIPLEANPSTAGRTRSEAGLEENFDLPLHWLR